MLIKLFPNNWPLNLDFTNDKNRFLNFCIISFCQPKSILKMDESL